MKIAIAGATGNIGSRVANQISAAGYTPILLGQNLDRLNKLNIINGISTVIDLSNLEQVIRSTSDVEALFWVVPPVLKVNSLKEWYDTITATGIAAVQQNKIKRVILISSLGAGAGEHQGVVSYCGDMEKAFDQSEANILALRTGYFMENILGQIENIRSKNELAFTYDADHDIPWVSTDDIGDTASKYLIDTKWAGHWKLNLMGPENITSKELALRISGILNREIRYNQKSIAEVSAEFERFGFTKMLHEIV